MLQLPTPAHHLQIVIGALRWKPRRLRLFYDKALQPSGLTSVEYHVLLRVASATEAVALSDIADSLVMTRPTLSRKLGSLERGGFLELLRDKHDRRIRRPRLTQLGQATFDAARQLWQAAEGR